MSYPKKSMLPVINFVTPQQLPLSCPVNDKDVLSLHPRVYLQFHDRQAICPYCGSVYEISEDNVDY